VAAVAGNRCFLLAIMRGGGRLLLTNCKIAFLLHKNTLEHGCFWSVMKIIYKLVLVTNKQLI